MLKTLKQKILALLAFAGILAFAVNAIATSTPVPAGGTRIESHLGVLNATQKETIYDSSTNAKFDEVVNVEVYVHNKELVNSGKDAKDVKMQVSLPGTKTTNHVITSVVGGSNTNVETLTATVKTNEASNLTYIPGSAIHTYNAGTNSNPNWVTKKIDDSIVGTGYVLGTVHPCCNFQESIIFQARVMIPTISITKTVKIDGVGSWQSAIQAQEGDKLNYLITVKNVGNTTLKDVVVRDSMPPALKYIPGSATLTNSNFPNGTKISDAVTQMGVNIGNYAPGAVAYVRLQATVPTDSSACNLTHKNVAHAKESTVGDYINNATVLVNCEEQKEARIRIIKFNDANANKVQDKGEANLAGWKFKVTGPSYEEVFTTDESGQVLITSLAAGKYTVTEILADGWTNTTGVTLTKEVTLGQTAEYRFGNKKNNTPETPETLTPVSLPTTGPAEIAGMIFGSMAVSGGTLSYLRSKKMLKNAYRK